MTGVELEESDSRREPESALISRLAQKAGDIRLRLLAVTTDDLLLAAHRANVPVICDPPVANARLELPHWVREQAISQTTHRHGRLLTET